MRDDPRMDPIEESVRRALEGGNPADQVFRRSIYAASRRAMERMIVQRSLEGAEADAERARVSAVIDQVEGEYAAYYGGEGYHPSEDHMPAGAQASAGGPGQDGVATVARATPDPAQTERAGGQGREPSSFAPPPARPKPEGEQGESWRPGAGSTGRTAPRRKAGRSVVFALFLVIAIAALLALGAFFLSGGDGETPVTQGTGSTQSATGPLSWIDVFTGSSLEQVSTPSGGRVTSVEDAGRPAIRISGPDGVEGEILINLGPGLVREIAGSEVRVELVAGSPDGEQREFAVRCLFGQDSVCERQRFATSMPEEAFVFDVTVPGGVGSPANLAIEPGLVGGSDVDVFSVRMRVL